MRRRARALGRLVAFAGTLGLITQALPAGARVPSGSQIANAVAKVNRAAGRGVPLAIEVDLEMGGGAGLLARGTLVADPGGASRLELSSPRGTWERHLRSGGLLRAVRNGQTLRRPRPFLPPVHLLLAASGKTLSGGLAALGARPGEVALGYEGASDCWVLGGRGRGPITAHADRAALWIDQETRQVVRIDLAGGTAYRLGPPKRFGKIQLPEWIEAWVEGAPLARLRVRGARSLRPAPGSFDPAWLTRAAPAN